MTIGNRNQTKIAITDEELKALVFTLSSISNVSKLPFQTEYQEILKNYIIIRIKRIDKPV